MSGWSVLTWLAASAVGPLTFLALVAHRVVDGVTRLAQLEEKERRIQQRRLAAEPKEITSASKPDHTATLPLAGG